MSKRYSVDHGDLRNWGKVTLYSAASAMLGAVIVSLASLDIPPQYLFMVPIINIILVALKDFLENTKAKK